LGAKVGKYQFYDGKTACHVTKFLGDDEVQLYQSYIGKIWWAVEFGRIDLAHASGAMARILAAPREGHMFMVSRMFAYCKKHMESKLVFDAMKRDFLLIRNRRLTIGNNYIQI
jgi:hypothetical protein